MPGRRKPDDRKVRRATANIGHQGQLLDFQSGFVVEAGRDGLELEVDVGKTTGLRHLAQLPLRQGVAFRRVVHKEHRPADDGGADLDAQLGLGALFEMAEKEFENLLELNLPVVQLGARLIQRRAENALERAQQAAFSTADVGVDGRLAEQVGAGVRFGEDGARNGELAGQQLDQFRTCGRVVTDGGIGRAEVDADYLLCHCLATDGHPIVRSVGMPIRRYCASGQVGICFAICQLTRRRPT